MKTIVYSAIYGDYDKPRLYPSKRSPFYLQIQARVQTGRLERSLEKKSILE